MKRIIMLCMCAMMLCSCGTEEKKNEDKVVSQTINCVQKEELMEDGAVLIDVRSASEYAEGHLDKSINLTVDTIGVNIETLIKDKDTKIIVYCRSGNRSATAADTLINLGYKNVYDLGAMSNCSN